MIDTDDLSFSTDATYWQIPEVQPVPAAPQSEMERCLKITGNWGEFGLYFGLGLASSLVIRAIPILQPSALILAPAIGAGLIALSFAAPIDSRTRCHILLIATTAAIIGGNWDGWLAWLVANAWKIGATLILIGASIYLIPTSFRGKKNG